MERYFCIWSHSNDTNVCDWVCDWVIQYHLCCTHRGMMQYLVMVLPVNKPMLYFQEEMQQREKREARLKKLKEEHGSARWRAKRKVDWRLCCDYTKILLTCKCDQWKKLCPFVKCICCSYLIPAWRFSECGDWEAACWRVTWARGWLPWQHRCWHHTCWVL